MARPQGDNHEIENDKKEITGSGNMLEFTIDHDSPISQ